MCCHHYHPQIKVFNLVYEKDQLYDTKYFTQKNIEVQTYPFRDHNPCKLRVIFDFCFEALLWLSKDKQNIIVIHCKAGKGRTGTMITSYLIFSNAVINADEAESMFNSRRAIKGNPFHIPSQRRYIRYFEQTFKKHYETRFIDFAMDYAKNPEQLMNKLIPRTTLALKFLVLGHMKEGLKVDFDIEDFDYNCIATTRKSMKKSEKTKLIKTTFNQHLLLNGLMQYELVFEEDIIIQDEVIITFYVDNMHFLIVFNLAFLHTYNINDEFLDDSLIIYSNDSEIIPDLYSKFFIKDIDRLHNRKEYQKKISTDFYIATGFNNPNKARVGT